MELQTHPPNILTMDAIDRKELLHLRIEQANEKLLEALVAMTEGLFMVYQPEAIEVVDEEEKSFAEEMKNIAPPSWAKPITREQFNAEIKASLAEYERGEYLTLEEVEQGKAA